MTATIRTFRAADARSALSAVKAALGPHAVILATKEVRASVFSKPEVEVTAALSYDPDATPRKNGSASPAPARKEPAVAAAPPAKNETAAMVSQPANPFSDEMTSLRATLDQVRRELRVVAEQSRAGHELQLAPAAASLFAHLAQRGVEETLAEELVRQAANMHGGAHPQALWTNVKELLGERLQAARAPWVSDRPRVIALVGPTGIGKTTTLAKIAAKALMESRIKVALITVDTYRVGASDQLARYGEIMKVPTHVATTQQELARAVDRCSSAELVLVDTAGRSLSEAVAQQATLIRSVPGIQLHLVMSAATGSSEISATAERYRGLRPDRLVFTKIDEASGPGSILSAAIRLGKPVACIADGQRVPEDIHAMNDAQLAELVMGNWNGTQAAKLVAGR